MPHTLQPNNIFHETTRLYPTTYGINIYSFTYCIFRDPVADDSEDACFGAGAGAWDPCNPAYAVGYGALLGL